MRMKGGGGGEKHYEFFCSSFPLSFRIRKGVGIGVKGGGTGRGVRRLKGSDNGGY